VFPDRSGARGTSRRGTALQLRRRPHFSSDRADRLCPGVVVRNAIASADVRIRRHRRVSVALLPAQTRNVQRSRSDHGSFRAGYVRDRRAGVARSVVDRHDDRRAQHAAAGAEGIPRKSDHENSGRRDSDVYEISAADLRHPAGRAEQGLRPVRRESVQGLADRRGHQRRLLRQLLVGESFPGQGRRAALGPAGRAVFVNLHDRGHGQGSQDGPRAAHLRGRHPDCLGRDVLPLSCADRNF
jgi:hypothetical protein